MAAPLKMEVVTPLGRVEIPVASKNSPVDKGIYWHSRHWSWQVKIGKGTHRSFSLASYLQEGGTEEEAKTQALKDARNYRDQILESCDPKLKAKLKTERKDATGPKSTVPGVSWSTNKRKWAVQISRTVDGKRKRFSGGCFDDREKAEAKARELATAHGERGAKAACAFDQLPIYVPMKPCKGVTWSKAEQLWRAQVQTPSGNLQFRARPKNHSKEELERSFDEAFQWVQQQKGKAIETKDKTVTLEEALEELMDQEVWIWERCDQ